MPVSASPSAPLRRVLPQSPPQLRLRHSSDSAVRNGGRGSTGRRSNGPWRPPENVRSSTSKDRASAPRSGAQNGRTSPVAGQRRSGGRRSHAAPVRCTSSTSSSDGGEPPVPNGCTRQRSSSYTAGSGVSRRRCPPGFSGRSTADNSDGNSARGSQHGWHEAGARMSDGVEGELDERSVAALIKQCTQLRRKVDFLEQVREADKQLAEAAAVTKGSTTGRATVDLLEAQEQRLECMYLSNLSLERRLRVAEQVAEEHKQRADDAQQAERQLRARLSQTQAQLSDCQSQEAGTSPLRTWPSPEGGELSRARSALAAEQRRADNAEELLRRTRQRVSTLEKELERLTVREQEAVRTAQAASAELAQYAVDHAKLTARRRASEEQWADRSPARSTVETVEETAALQERVWTLEKERERHREVRVSLRQEITELSRRLAAADAGLPVDTRPFTPRPVTPRLGSTSFGAAADQQRRARSPAAMSEASVSLSGFEGRGSRAQWAPSTEPAESPRPVVPRRTASPRPLSVSGAAGGDVSPRGPVGVGSAGSRSPRPSAEPPARLELAAPTPAPVDPVPSVGEGQLRVGDWIWYDDGVEPPQHAVVVDSELEQHPPTFLVRLSDGRERRAQHPGK
eukprot:Hpha_TRINITY_DN6729_c0_g1::TRINITY_DN6729_c0_g1_i1::g.110973::m.110973